MTTKKYQFWTDFYTEGYKLQEFDSLSELPELIRGTYGHPYLVTKACPISVVETSYLERLQKYWHRYL